MNSTRFCSYYQKWPWLLAFLYLIVHINLLQLRHVYSYFLVLFLCISVVKRHLFRCRPPVKDPGPSVSQSQEQNGLYQSFHVAPSGLVLRSFGYSDTGRTFLLMFFKDLLLEEFC